VKKRSYDKGSTRRYAWEIQVTDATGLLAYEGLFRKRDAIRRAKTHPLDPGIAFTVINVRTGKVAYRRNQRHLMATPEMRERYAATLRSLTGRATITARSTESRAPN
jgi:uncharacterized membrane protein